MTTSLLTLDNWHVSGGIVRFASIVRLARQSVDANQDARVVLLVSAGEADGRAWRECATPTNSDLGTRHLRRIKSQQSLFIVLLYQGI